MQAEASGDPWWAILIVWCVVNAVNVLQATGFISRVRTGSQSINHQLGYGMILIAVPATLALIAFWRAKAGWLQWVGLVVYLAFVMLMVVVEYIRPIEFRSPALYGILVPYLLLFFGSILLMGLPMFGINRLLWLVTVTTTVLLLGSMGIALRKGMG